MYCITESEKNPAVRSVICPHIRFHSPFQELETSLFPEAPNYNQIILIIFDIYLYPILFLEYSVLDSDTIPTSVITPAL